MFGLLIGGSTYVFECKNYTLVFCCIIAISSSISC